MIRCSRCGNTQYRDRDVIGARCPSCREPLYEAPRDPHVPSGTGSIAAGTRCATHPNNAAVAVCERCGNFLCSVCWTRWRSRALCIGCTARALDANEAAPVEVRAHLRQAVLACIGGGLAWLMTLGAGILMALGLTAGEPNAILLGFGVLALLGSPLFSILGVGQGAAAIRARGNHMILATMGLILSGLHVGIVVGMFTVAIIGN